MLLFSYARIPGKGKKGITVRRKQIFTVILSLMMLCQFCMPLTVLAEDVSPAATEEVQPAAEEEKKVPEEKPEEETPSEKEEKSEKPSSTTETQAEQDAPKTSKAPAEKSGDKNGEKPDKAAGAAEEEPAISHQILKTDVYKDDGHTLSTEITAETEGDFINGTEASIRYNENKERYELHFEGPDGSAYVPEGNVSVTLKTHLEIEKIVSDSKELDFKHNEEEYKFTLEVFEFALDLKEKNTEPADETSDEKTPEETSEPKDEKPSDEESGKEGEFSEEPPLKAPLRGDPAETYNIVINYIYSDNAIAYEPYVHTVPAGGSVSETVMFPVIQGYEAYYQDARADSLDLNYTDIQSNITLTVQYKPIPVTYQVRHYWQNADNDNYTLHETETLTGYTGDTVEGVDKVYEGFAVLAYENANIAADGSTVVEIRYDREYSLIRFNLDGGYGVDPIYAKWGSTLSVGTPSKVGHSFAGWDHEIPETMPYGGDTFTASWTPVGSLYNIIYWKENADDDDYSYWGSELRSAQTGTQVSGTDTIPSSIAGNEAQYFTFNDELTDKNVIVKGDGTTLVNVYYDRKVYTISLINASGNDYVCGLEAHTHSYDHRGMVYYGGCYPGDGVPDLGDEYAICGHEEHAHSYDRRAYVYTGGCYGDGNESPVCGIEEHTHSRTCYSGAQTNTASSTARNSLNRNYDQVNGSIGSYLLQKYIYINGTWYRYNGSGTAGNIVNANCGKTEHTHSYDSRAYRYFGGCYPAEGAAQGQTVCGHEEHHHVADGSKYRYYGNCYPDTGADEGRYTCGLEEHTHTNSCRGTLIHRITAKYGADISDEWDFDGLDGNHYPQTSPQNSSWMPVVSSIYSQRLYDIQVMPAEHSIFKVNYTSNTLRTYYYYVETLPGATPEHTYNGMGYVLHYTLTHDFRIYTEAEDFYTFDGFTKQTARYSNDTRALTDNTNLNSNNITEANFFYTRNRYRIDYQSNGETLTEDADGNSLTTSTYTQVPYEMSLAGYDIEPPYPEAFPYGAYEFAGWYDNANYAGQPFNFSAKTMESSNLILFAKWTPSPYTVRLFQDRSKAEGGAQPLNTYQAYYGDVLDAPAEPTPEDPEYVFIGWFYAENGVEKPFTFGASMVTKDLDVYAKWSSNSIRPYNIYYKDADGNEIAEPTSGSAYAGTTKTFDAKDLVPSGYFPRQQSHSLLIDIEGTQTNGINDYTFIYDALGSIPYTVRYLDIRTHEQLLPDKVVDPNNDVLVTEKFRQIAGYVPDAYQKKMVVAVNAANTITFYYTKDTEHAFYLTSHFIEDGNGWTLYNELETYGNIGDSVNARPMTIPGYHLDRTVSGTVDSGTVSAAGLEMKLYYVGDAYPYKVRYVDSRTGLAVREEKLGSGKVDTVVTETAPDITGYDCTNGPTRSITIQTEDDPSTPVRNVITFYYQIQQAEFNYVVVGPAGCGAVDNTREVVAAYAGTALGSTATASSGYRFDGWYKDAACTNAVTALDGSVSGNKFTPAKRDGRYYGTTYYAKFIVDSYDFSVVKTGTDGRTNLTATFTLYREGGSQTITYGGNSVSVTPEGNITTPQTVSLSAGETYYLAETTAPEMYLAWEGKVKITVTQDGSLTILSDMSQVPASVSGTTLTLTDEPLVLVPSGHKTDWNTTILIILAGMLLLGALFAMDAKEEKL